MLHHSCEGSQHKNVNNTYPFVKRQKKHTAVCADTAGGQGVSLHVAG